MYDASLHTDQHGTSWLSDGPPPCLNKASHGWVPVNTHGTPVLTSVRRPWVAQPRPHTRADDTQTSGTKCEQQGCRPRSHGTGAKVRGTEAGSKFVRFKDRIHEVHFIKGQNRPKDIYGPLCGLSKFQELPDLIISGLKFGQACRQQLRRRRSRNGLLKNQNSTMLEV